MKQILDKTEEPFHKLKKIVWSAIRRTDTEVNMVRLDASAYCSAVESWDPSESQHKISRLQEIAKVKQPIIFGKRFMAGSPEKGIPVYSSSEMLRVDPEPAFYLSVKWQDVIQELTVREGWILISRTGTVGNVAWVSEQMDGVLVDDHMIRIIPLEKRYAGLLYAFLNSPPGQGIIARLMYGAVQQVIKAVQVEEINIPLFDDNLLRELTNKIKIAANLRASAWKMMSGAGHRLMEIVGLPAIKPSEDARVAPRSQGEVIRLKVSEMLHSSKASSEYRLDAHFYNPTAQQAVANIKACRSSIKTVGEVTERIFFCNRFTRTFVEKDHGIPYLAGKNITQIRPTNQSYLSRSQTIGLDQYRLKQGWTLITCSGTIGRTCFVWKNFEEFVGTHDLIRVVPNIDVIDEGYLYAFLSSPYGYEQILRYKHGSVIDHVTPEQVQMVLVPCPSRKDQEAIGDMVRQAYEQRAEALRLEDEAQAILMAELTKAQATREE